MAFVHTKVDLPTLTEKYIDGRRHYCTPEGNMYPSITTVLSLVGREKLQEWKDKVGEAEAERYGKMMAKRGSSLHEICEKYLRNDPDYLRGQMPDSAYLFRQIKPKLDMIDEVGVLEQQLYSDRLRVAGRCDVIASFMRQYAIIDFKASNQETEYDHKVEVSIHDNKIKKYFVQCYGYREMYKELTGKKVKWGILMVASMDHGPRLYIDTLDKYETDFLTIRKQYDIENNITGA